MSGALLVAVLTGPALAGPADPFEGCEVTEAGFTTLIECGLVELTVEEGAKTDLPAALGSWLSRQAEHTDGVATSRQTALQSSQGLLPAARTEWTPKGAGAPTEAWLTVAAPSPVGSVLVTCRARFGSGGTSGRCDEQVSRVVNKGLPAHLNGLVGSQGGDWATVESKVGRPVPSLPGCETQSRASSLVHMCEDGIVAVALIPSPRSGGEVWQRQFLDGVLGGLPAGHVVGDEDSLPCELGGTETTCTRVHVTDRDGDTSWVISAGAEGAGSYYTAICTYPDVGFALPLYCRALYGPVPPEPAKEDTSGRKGRSGRRQAR